MPRTKTAAEPAPDARTGDLLAHVDEKRSDPPFDMAAAPAEAKPAPLALATLNPVQYVAEVYQPFRAKFAAFKEEADAIETLDASTKEGMATAIRLRAAFRDEVRLAATHAHKDRKAPILEIGRLLDAKKNEIIAAVEPYETRFDAAIKAEEKRKEEEKAAREKAEAERVAAIRAKIDAISALATQHANASSDVLKAVLTELAAREVMKEEFAEFAGEASLALEATGSALHVLYNGAIAREQAEAERIRLAEEEKARIAAQEEANKREQDRLAAEREKVERAQQEAARAAAALKMAQEQQQRTMDAITELTALCNTQGSVAELTAALGTAAGYAITPELFGAGVAMVQMAQSMAVKALDPRLDQSVKDAPLDEEVEPAPTPAEFGTASGIDSPEVAQAKNQRARAMLDNLAHHEPAPEPAPLPEPEAYSPIDEQIDIGVVEGPTDAEIVDLVADGYGMTRGAALARLAQIDFKALES